MASPESPEIPVAPVASAPEAAPAPAPTPATAAAPAAAEPAKPQTINDVFLSLEGGAAEAPKVVRAKGSKNVSKGIVHVVATFNNTIVSVSDERGNVIGWSSAGKMGFRGSRKGTAYAAQVAPEKAANVAKTQYGLSKVDIFVKGIGQGRDMAMRAILNMDIAIESIKDVTGVPHGGVRPRKARRN